MKQWHGQQDECPIDANKLIDATYRNGSTQRAYAGDFRWRWMQDSYDVVAYSVIRQRKHSQDILDKLDECRKNKQDIGIDYKKLCDDGFDANSGCIVSLLRTHLTPISNEEIEWLLTDSRASRYGMKLEAEHNNYRMYSVDKQAFMNVRQNIPTHIGKWKLMFVNSKDGVVFYKQFLDNNK